LTCKWSEELGPRRVLRFQRGNQESHIEEEQTTQRQKENVQKDKQRSTKHTLKSKDQVNNDLTQIGFIYCAVQLK
jgi:hypothetical protein